MILAFFFYQTVGGANIWEFLLPAGFILSLFTALTLALLLKKTPLAVRIIVLCMVIVFVIPRWAATVTEEFHNEYLSGFHGISNEEYASYDYLKRHVAADERVMVVNHTEPVVLVSDIKIFAGVPLYLSGEGTRQQVTPEILKRRNLVQTIKNENYDNNFAILNSEKVKYLYYYGQAPQTVMNKDGFTVVFRNKEATIIRVD